MPVYTFTCASHGKFTQRRAVCDRELPALCPVCEKESPYTPTFETQPPKLVGSGFYETDYKKKGKDESNS